jgi:hypothetical protein
MILALVPKMMATNLALHVSLDMNASDSVNATTRPLLFSYKTLALSSFFKLNVISWYWVCSLSKLNAIT